MRLKEKIKKKKKNHLNLEKHIDGVILGPILVSLSRNHHSTIKSLNEIKIQEECINFLNFSF